MRRPPYDCELDERKLHVFLDGRLTCECCRRVNPDLQRCKHRPQADVRAGDNKEVKHGDES